jgi:DNA polymerase I-like protein with 3'-5' exonuclease and polymerase domains
MDFPRLEKADIIGIDCETYDPQLRESGTGVLRNGYVVGLAVATRDAEWYFPIRHGHGGSGNLDVDAVYRWANVELGREGQPKVGANLPYDLGYLWHEGVEVRGRMLDIQVAEPLLNENRFSYSLETLAQEYLGVGKDEDAMTAWQVAKFGGKAHRQKDNIWRTPPDIVAPYAKGDVRLPILIMDKQRAELDRQDLMPLFALETDLLPLLVRMFLRGVRVDEAAAGGLSKQWSALLKEVERGLGGLNPGSGKQIAERLDRLGVKYPRTEKGNPRLGADVLEAMVEEVPLIAEVMRARKLRHFNGTFVEGYVLKRAIEGRVHGQFNQLRGDDTGTVSGRLSSTNPNLQNIPSPDKDKEFGPLIRGLFVPEPGEDWWRYDYSQIEYRLLVHYAAEIRAAGWRDPVEMYANDPATDFHQMCSDLTGVPRKQAKNINFGLVYGMGVVKLAHDLGLPIDEAKDLFEVYHERAPFVKAFSKAATNRATRMGYVRTIAGRRRRFPDWEPNDWEKARTSGAPLPLEEAREKWGAVRRAFTHKAANSILQGSSADITKKAMVDGLKAGLYDVIGLPLVTVHDELGFSVPRTKEAQEAAAEMRVIMEKAFVLNVPVLVSVGQGNSWGSAG